MSTGKNDEFSELVNDINESTEENLRGPAIMDLNTLGKQYLDDLNRSKKMRSEMIVQRASLKRAISKLDKRIEIAVNAIKTLQS